MSTDKPRRPPRAVRHDPRVERRVAVSLDHQRGEHPRPDHKPSKQEVLLDCGWGNLILAQTYSDPAKVAQAVQDEPHGRRNIAIYVRDPHVILAQAPQALFLDPSHTFRLWLNQYQAPHLRTRGFTIRRLRTREDAEAVNRIYAQRGMVPADPEFIWRHRASRNISYIVAEDLATGEVFGTTTGIDYQHAFGDPEGGSSLWCLAVDPQATQPGVGQALVRYLAEHFQARGRAFMDLSVMHDNTQAIALYEKLGFVRVPVFTIKTKNAINEPLYRAPPPKAESGLNIYARIITDEARRRGIRVQVQDAEHGYFRLSFGGRFINCRESLSDLTSAVTMSRCQDKAVTHRLLADAGLKVPAQRQAGDAEADAAFLQEHGSIVVKPADGEQGAGISVDVRSVKEMEQAIAQARRVDARVLLEQYCAGEDLRIIVIGERVVAAAVRRPPIVVGDGRHSIRELIEKLSRRRSAATGGESKIPLDEETERCVRLGGHELDAVLAAEEKLAVRKTANLHTGGTLHDVTPILHRQLCEAAIKAARALEIPVTGLDFIVQSADRPDYVVIEANERPGLANHEPQPTAERFLDLLFPGSGEPQIHKG